MTPQALKLWRVERNRTQTQLGAALGVSQRVVSSWETGRSAMPLDMAQRLHAAPEVNPAQVASAAAVVKQAVDYIRANGLAGDDALRLALQAALKEMK